MVKAETKQRLEKCGQHGCVHVSEFCRDGDRSACPSLGHFNLAAKARCRLSAGRLVEHVELVFEGPL